MGTEVRNRINELEVARILGISPSTLRKWRCKDVGLPYYRVGGRIVYDIREVEAFLQSCRHEPADLMAA
jgi:DNA-binding transcriptional MerR regulator